MQFQQRRRAFPDRQDLDINARPLLAPPPGEGTLCRCGLGACGLPPGPNVVPRLHEFRRAREVIHRLGEPCEEILTICSGWAFRYEVLRNGRRQILSLLLPGDIVSANALFGQPMDFSVDALTNVRFGRLSRVEVAERLPGTAFLDLVSRLMRAERRDADEQLIDLGQRRAEERIARLILRLRARHLGRGGVDGDSFPFPLRQQHIADIAGLTLVHVSRIMASLRKKGVMDISAGFLTLHRLAELQRIGDMR